MPRLLLIRHAQTDWVGRAIAGRTPSIPLNAVGRAQARDLAEALAPMPLARILSSPLERARETAAALAAGRDVPVEVAPELDEVDSGVWTGRAVADLRGDERWTALHAFRSGHAIPGGESLLDVQRRVVTLLLRLRDEAGDTAARIALVTHGDAIRAAVVHFLGMPLDLVERLTIPTASVTALRLEAWGAELQGVGWTVAPPGADAG